MFKALSRANREMQLENWTPVILDLVTMLKIAKDQSEHLIQPADDLKATAVAVFLQEWLRQHNKAGFALRREAASYNIGHKVTEPCLTFLFKLSSEAVRFKLTWGGR